MTRQTQPADSSGSRMHAFVADLFAAWNTHDLDRVLAFYAPDYEGQDVAQEGTQYGHEGMRQTLARYFQALPDVRFGVDDVIVDGERAAVVWTAEGTHMGSLMHVPASGRRVTVRGMPAFTLSDGKVCRATYMWDVAGLLRKIGVLPDL